MLADESSRAMSAQAIAGSMAQFPLSQSLKGPLQQKWVHNNLGCPQQAAMLPFAIVQ